MEWKKEVPIDEVIEICKEYLNGEISQEDLEKWGKDRIKIRFYLPIEEKSFCVDNLINNLYYDNNSIFKSVMLEMNKFWYILLEYTNIENLEQDKFTIENYDIIYSCLGNWIFSLVQLDYNSVEKIIDTAMNYLNILSLTNIVSGFDIKNIENLTKIDKNILKILKDPKMIDQMSQLLNGSLSKEEKIIKEELQKKAVEIAKETIK